MGPDRAYYFYRRALSLEQLERFAEAAVEFGNLLVHDSSAQAEIVERSDALAEQGHLAGASAYLDALEQNGYQGPALTTRRLRILVTQSSWAKAEEISREALNQDPEDRQLQSIRAEVLQRLAGEKGEVQQSG